jgi:hypothetical protein
MLRGDCPVRGIKITGYVTPAARHCAIAGGMYKIAADNNIDREQGTCTFKNGRTCDVWDYFAGKCSPDTAAVQSSFNDPFAYCAAVGTIDAPNERYKGAKMRDSIIQAMVRQGIVSADAPQKFQKNAVWRCMSKGVWVCHFGADLPCLEKADRVQVPTPVMEDHCKTNPSANSIPAAVRGRATLYEGNARVETPRWSSSFSRVVHKGIWLTSGMS